MFIQGMGVFFFFFRIRFSRQVQTLTTVRASGDGQSEQQEVRAGSLGCESIVSGMVTIKYTILPSMQPS